MFLFLLTVRRASQLNSTIGDRKKFHRLRAYLTGLRDWLDGPDFDAAFTTPASRGDLGGPMDGFIQIFAVEDVVAGELFFRFRKGTVGNNGLTGLRPDGGCSSRRFQRFR